MPERYCLDLSAPANGFPDSFLIGNGRLGATVQGGIATERIDINLDRLWSGGPMQTPTAPSPASLLPALRKAIREGDFAGADALARKMQGTGYTQSYQPVAGLRFRFGKDTGDVTGYRRRLDLAAAEASVSYAGPSGRVELSGFVSAPQDVAVFFAGGEGLLYPGDMTLSWDCLHPSTTGQWTEGDRVWARVTGRVPTRVIPPYVQAEVAIFYPADGPDRDGLVDAGMGFAAVAVLSPDSTGRYRLMIAADCGFRGHDARPSADVAAMAANAEKKLRAALAISSDLLTADHRADYKRYFGRVDLQLPQRPHDGFFDPAKAELFFHLGRYLLISSSRPGTEPANLQGIWNPYVRPAWSCNHTTNINTEMNYWAAEASDLGDLAEPLMTLIHDIVTAGKATAAYHYGAPGSVVHHNTDLWRFTQPVQGTPVWANWPSSLPWLLSHAYDHWDYGSAGDSFARDRLLPMMAEVARFILFMLVENDKGELIFSPSTSPEQSYLDADGTPYGVTEGSAMDQELCRQLLDRLVALSARFGRETTLAREASAALARLALPVIDATGAIQEWARPLTPAEPGHRHLSHLYGLFPADRIQPGSAEYTAARIALDQRFAGGTGHTGWSQAWVLCIAARIAEPVLAAQAFAKLLSDLVSASYLVLHPYEGMPGNVVFQIDGNFGGTAGIIEMLMQSVAGEIRLLPTLPVSWDSGSFRGLKARGGHRLDLIWANSHVKECCILAGRGGPLSLDIPEAVSIEVADAQTGAPVHAVIVAGTNANRQKVTWHAEAGIGYRLRAAI